jgi:hypothetical protein
VKPLYIFDLDGTLALIGHRRHFVECPRKQQDWTGFYAACDKDERNEPIIEIMEMLLHSGNDVWVFSGRSDEVRNKTLNWLDSNTSFCLYSGEDHEALQMRDSGDFTPDDILKKQWLDAMLPEDRERLVCVFDDRDRVVKMWRDNGITCLQVAPGEF